MLLTENRERKKISLAESESSFATRRKKLKSKYFLFFFFRARIRWARIENWLGKHISSSSEEKFFSFFLDSRWETHTTQSVLRKVGRERERRETRSAHDLNVSFWLWLCSRMIQTMLAALSLALSPHAPDWMLRLLSWWWRCFPVWYRFYRTTSAKAIDKQRNYHSISYLSNILQRKNLFIDYLYDSTGRIRCSSWLGSDVSCKLYLSKRLSWTQSAYKLQCQVFSSLLAACTLCTA